MALRKGPSNSDRSGKYYVAPVAMLTCELCGWHTPVLNRKTKMQRLMNEHFAEKHPGVTPPEA